MANILIKRKVTLDFLGEEYKDSYLMFKAVSIAKFIGIQSEIEKIQNDNQASMNKILEILKEQFVSGVFLGEEVTKTDLDDFDSDTILKSFSILSGESDPKDEPSLTTTSSTEVDTAKKL